MAKYFFYDTDIIKFLLEKEMASGGAAVQSYIWLEGLKELGNEVCIATYKDQTGRLRPGVEQIELVPLYDRTKGVRWIRWITHRFPVIYQALKSTRPDYLYESIPSWTSFFTAIICKRLDIKYIIRLSSDNILDKRYLARYSRLSRLFLKMGIHLSDYVLCQNDYQYSLLKKHFPKKKALKIHNPFKLQVQNKRHDHKRTYIAWVANFRFPKNMRLLYEVASTMKDEAFQIAGTYLISHPEVDEYLPKLKLLKNVKFKGHVERQHILDFLSKAKYLLNTSYYEGFSNTYLEAMSVGTPILATHNANPDLIINRNNIGIIYRDSEDLKQKLNEVSEADYQQLSDRAVDYVKTNHHHISLTKKLVRFLEGEDETDHSIIDYKIMDSHTV